MCAVVHDNFLYVANLGDCEGKVFRKTSPVGFPEQISYTAIKLNNAHNAKKHEEQKRLKDKFTDLDIIVEKGCSCYVKGRLQCTKTIGDFYLKHQEFNDPPKNMLQKYSRRAIDNFRGPYIENIPEIFTHELNENDEFITLATDGLWDWLSSKEVAEIILMYRDNKSNIAGALCEAALKKAADQANLKMSDIINMSHKEKRSIHDDITVLVVDLKNQVTYKNKNSMDNCIFIDNKA